MRKNMKDGFIRVAAATPDVKVADPVFNRKQICKCIEEGWNNQAKIMVFPELALTAYTCGDLFRQKALIERAKKELEKILEFTVGHDMLVFVGLPWDWEGKLYNAAAVLQDGQLLGVVPKCNIPNYSEFYEMRYFEPGNPSVDLAVWHDEAVPFGMNLLFRCDEMPELTVAAEICEDVWVPCPPSTFHAIAGATVVVNCSSSNESTGKAEYRDSLIAGQSARCICGYIYANAGEGESTQDLVFGGHSIISENGVSLAVSKRFKNGIIYGDMDLGRILSERMRMTSYRNVRDSSYTIIDFSMELEDVKLRRRVDHSPFVPDDAAQRLKRCEEILSIQAMGLKKRLSHTGCQDVVLGVSGGLDSTLALLVTARSFDMLDIPRNRIHCITMPCFGTTDRTYQNACRMAESLGADLEEINIRQAVSQHFQDIGHDPKNHDVTYENSQARERTQILMDLANRYNGMVIGTGDMSELALGWATYNGDHMSMYGVNASVPKTLVRYLVQYYADTCLEPGLAAVLLDVLDTPVSPELLPPENGIIAQKTEDLVGPYELHDFYLYYVMRFGFTPSKIYRLAVCALGSDYDKTQILKWLKVFYRRFFSQQFKRSCLPDGPKVGSVALSPRGDWRMPSDACVRIWMEELEQIEVMP